jgi:hypothetical protein
VPTRDALGLPQKNAEVENKFYEMVCLFSICHDVVGYIHLAMGEEAEE